MNQLIRIWVTGMKWFITLCPPIIILGILLLPVFDTYFPSTVMKDILMEKYPEQFPICVGISSERHGNDFERKERSYILFPNIFYNPKVISIAVENSKEAEVSESLQGLIFLILCDLFFLFLTIKVSIPNILPFYQKMRKRKLPTE